MKAGCLMLLIVLALVSPTIAGGEEAGNFASWGGVEVRGDGPSHFDLAAGLFDVSDEPTAVARVEARGGRKLGFLGPAAGVLVTADGSLLGYAGFYADLAVRHLILTPLFAVGAYHDGGGKDLGGTLEFRSALTLAWRLDSGSRLGVQVAHVSNAETYEENPGENEVMLSFTRPF